MPRLSRGEPWYCFNTHNANQKMTLADGTPLSPALGIGAFAEKTLVAAGQCTKVDPATKPEVAGLLGCGVMAGLGAAINTGGVRRGDTVAVFGCGGVGDAAIVGASVAGARTIIAVDVDDRKLEWARGFGATHAVNSRQDAVVAVKEHTGGFGADVTIEAVGRPELYRQAFYARDLAGRGSRRCPQPGHDWTTPLIDIFGRGGSLKSSWYGDCLPSRDFPMLVDLHLPGRLPLEKFVSETIGLDDVEEAFTRWTRRGPALRRHSLTAVEQVVTTGTFSLDGGTWDVDNNVWLVGGDDEVVVIDAAHDADRHRRGRPQGDVRSSATHGHNDHINAAADVGANDRCPGLAAPGGPMLWDEVYTPAPRTTTSRTGTIPGRSPDHLIALHTPGHSPGAVCLSDPSSAWCSPGTRCSPVARAQRGGCTPTSRRSAPRSAAGSWTCPARPPCTPAMATTRRSAARRRTTTSGSPAATDMEQIVINILRMLVVVAHPDDETLRHWSLDRARGRPRRGGGGLLRNPR